MTSLPTPGGLNLTLRTPQPGARPPPRAQSHVVSYIHPLAAPVGIRPGVDERDLSVLKTFSGFVLRTSHTTTTPSCEPTANFDPSAEKAVEKDAGIEDTCGKPPATSCGCWMNDDSESVAMGASVILDPPVILCRYTSGESPTHNNVRPSGEMEAVRPRMQRHHRCQHTTVRTAAREQRTHSG